MAYINGKEVLFSPRIVMVNSSGVNHYDTFWDNFQNYGNRRNYNVAFRVGWNDANYNPKYPIICDSTGGNLGAADIFTDNMDITDTKVEIDISGHTNSRLMFSNCKNLKTVKKLIVSENVTYDRTFQNSSSLENIIFVGVIGKTISFAWSSKLSDVSIQNIIDHLADLTGGTAQTLTLHATVGAKLTDEQKAIITAKNWTLAY